ncbi:MAG: hypothetical protein ABIH23_06035, partial [bacterium]
MSDTQSGAKWFLNTALNAVGHAIDVHSGRQLNQFEIAASRTRFDFFNTLAQDQDTSGYVTRLQDELFTAYDELAENLKNPFVKQKVTDFLDKKKEEDRQAAIELSQRNAQVFGGQELITGLEDLIARGRDATESYLGDGNTPSYQQRVERDINSKVGRAYASGIINQDRAMQLVRDYTERFRVGFARDMAYNALDVLMTNKVTSSDALDLIEKVVRSEGGDLEDVVGAVDLDIDPGAIAQLSILAQAKANVLLSPEDQESLVRDLRGEASA